MRVGEGSGSSFLRRLFVLSLHGQILQDLEAHQARWISTGNRAVEPVTGFGASCVTLQEQISERYK